LSKKRLITEGEGSDKGSQTRANTKYEEKKVPSANMAKAPEIPGDGQPNEHPLKEGNAELVKCWGHKGEDHVGKSNRSPWKNNGETTGKSGIRKKFPSKKQSGMEEFGPGHGRNHVNPRKKGTEGNGGSEGAIDQKNEVGQRRRGK